MHSSDITCLARVTVDLIRRSWVPFPPRSKEFSLPRVVPWFPLLGLTPSGSFMGFTIYTSELILCSTICVHSVTRHNIHMYPYFVFAAIHHLNRPRLSLSYFVAQSAEYQFQFIKSNGRSNPEVVGSIPTEVKIFYSLPRVVPWFPLLGLTPSGSFMGFT